MASLEQYYWDWISHVGVDGRAICGMSVCSVIELLLYKALNYFALFLILFANCEK